MATSNFDPTKYGAISTNNSGAVSSATSTGAFDPLKYGAVAASPVSAQTVSSSNASSQGFFADALGDAVKALVVKPAARLSEAVGRTGILGNTIKQGYEDMSQGNSQTINFPGTSIDISNQKAFGQGGGAQIASDALKSASYLAPYGKIGAGTASLVGRTLAPGVAGGVEAGVANTLANSIKARVASGVITGATGGYLTDVSNHLESKGITPSAFVPGFATILGGVTGGVLEGGAASIDKISGGAQAYSKELEQQSFKLTPTQKSKLAPKLDELSKFSMEKIPSGTPEERYNFAKDLYDHYEENLQKALSSSDTEVVNKTKFIESLQSLKDSYKYDRDSEALAKQIDSAVSHIQKTYPGDAIPVDKLNVFKRSTYQNAFNKAGDKVSDVVEYDIADMARSAIEKATKKVTVDGQSISEFNREYGNLIQLKKILKLAQGRPEMGFTKRIVSRIIGGLVGHSLGGLPGLVGGELIAEPIGNKVAGTGTKTAMAKKFSTVKPTNIGLVSQRLRP